jgi:hypothetical protein
MRQVTVTGGDLYHVALQYLGDATQWNRIAQANPNPAGGPPMDTIISGVVTLNIPAMNPLAGGGILVL